MPGPFFMLGHMADPDSTLRRFASFDGAELAFHDMGSGRTVVLLHGLFSDAVTNWIRYGHAKLLVNKGFRVVALDLRAHGSSAKPHDAGAYPRDALASDGLALLAHLGLSDYDLCGYSLGARTAIRMLLRGAKPRRAVVAGMGLSGLTETGPRTDWFKHVIDHAGQFESGTPGWFADSFLNTTRGDRIALRHLLDTNVDSSRDEIATVAVPTLVLSGIDDADNGSVEDLAALLPAASLVRVPGNHMSAVTKPDLGHAIADFLTA
jgi:pimeloyl-ACP methyl ester carboxylesterase